MHTYSILDGARMLEKLGKAKELNADSVSLYAGLPLEVLESISPYIFFLQPGNGLNKMLVEEGWGKSWGIYVCADADGEVLYHHFRKFITVFTDQGRELYFRFYDPRALRIFLPTCDENQLTEFFGPVDSFILEDKDPEYALEFRLHGRKLITDRIKKTKWFERLIPEIMEKELDTV